jgi:hypothetical protein
MTTQPTEPLYKKQGRRYVPAYSVTDWSFDCDAMRVGTFRLTYAFTDGGRRYEHDVTPDTAGWAAAALLAKHAMVEAMRKASTKHLPATSKLLLTKKQQQAVAQARAILQEAGVLSSMWESASPENIADAAIATVLQHAKAPDAIK